MTQQATTPELQRPRHAVFRFTETSLTGHELRLGYQLAGGPDPDLSFQETLLLDVSGWN